MSLPASSGEVKPPPGPYKTALPQATPEPFRNAEKFAPLSKPNGQPGVSSRAATGGSAPANGPAAFGQSTAPYTTARVAVTTLGKSNNTAHTPVTSYPYSATGKLYFQESGGTFVCTASLIKPGVLLTAAHCVFNFGQGANGWYSQWIWCPANSSSAGGVYGCYSADSPRVLTTYYDGSDICEQTGVVCNDDMATLGVAKKNGVYPGQVVGWYNYSWNGYSYEASTFLGNVTTVEVTQLGYPAAFDGGYQMERTDAVGWYYNNMGIGLQNTQIGTAQTGGSSGGPWLANFGAPPVISSDASLGASAEQTIVGVTSYGATTVGYNRQGASYLGQNSQYTGSFGSYGEGNIGELVSDTCTAHPKRC